MFSKKTCGLPSGRPWAFYERPWTVGDAGPYKICGIFDVLPVGEHSMCSRRGERADIESAPTDLMVFLKFVCMGGYYPPVYDNPSAIFFAKMPPPFTQDEVWLWFSFYYWVSSLMIVGTVRPYLLCKLTVQDGYNDMDDISKFAQTCICSTRSAALFW